MIPAVADSWLQKYGLTQKELFDNRVVWSEYRQLLVFPYFDDKGFLWGWQGRYFGSDSAHPKWTGKGNFKAIEKIYTPSTFSQNLDLTEPTKDSIIIVEDIISTIKVSRQFPTICLFGSFIDLSKILKHKNKTISIWLDKDKEKESRLYSLQFNKLGVQSSSIVTNKDPKDYNNNEIKEIILNETNNK